MKGPLYSVSPANELVHEINVLDATKKQLIEISDELGLCMSLLEMQTAQTYFREEKRNPTDVELQTIGQTWSEHCFHKTFKGKIKVGNKEIDSLFKTYIIKATEKIDAPWAVSVFEDNAGIVEFDKGYAIATKVETHNHPSAIEPFGGAATGVGGVIRDILGVWADPIACTDVLGFGPQNYEYAKLPPGVKHPKYIYLGVTAGIGTYGNNMGIPTVNGAIYFDESYTGNVVVYCGCIGLLPLNSYAKNAKVGDLILIAGGKTGRDGIHGVTFASAELTDKSEEISRPAVQIADPIEEEKLKRAFIEVRDRKLGSATTDLGGGGLSSALGETAKRFSCGATVELDEIPLKHEGVVPWEVYVSESQERMLLTIPPENLQKTLEVFEKEEVTATVIGKLTKDPRLRLYHKNVIVADLDMGFLFNPPGSSKTAIIENSKTEEPVVSEPKDLTEKLLALLAAPNIASKEPVVRSYDHEVKGNTLLKPLQGDRAGPNDAAVIKPLNDSNKGLVISCGMNPNYGKISSYWMAASAIDEAIRNNIAVGGRRIALLDNFVWGNPEKPERLGSLLRACEACYDFATAFKTPFISGKDSLYNESPLGAVTPTLLITAIGIIPNVGNTVSMDFKSAGDSIYIVGMTYSEMGGSEYYKLENEIGMTVPEVRQKEAKKIFKTITKAIDSKLVSACHDISEGGAAIAVAEMALASEFGAQIDARKIPRAAVNRTDFALFSESNSRFIVEVPEDSKPDFERLWKGIPHAEIGKTQENQRLTVKGLSGLEVINVSLENMKSSWKSTFGRKGSN
jgi:phosphoribosylformylglycinamidine synthase II